MVERPGSVSYCPGLLFRVCSPLSAASDSSLESNDIHVVKEVIMEVIMEVIITLRVLFSAV